MVRGLSLVIIAGFLFVAGSALMYTGCAKQRVPATDAGQPLVDFRPGAQVGGEWTGDIIVAGQVVARGLTYVGEGDLQKGGVVRVAWVPPTMTVAPAGTGSSQWWYAGGVLLYILAVIVEEVGRRRMREARA